MHFLSAVAAVAALISSAAAAPSVPFMSGFNLGANRAADNQCKTTADWQLEFETIVRWGNKNPTVPKAQFRAVKLFSSGDCNALMNAVPAALAAGVKIWVGVWNVPDWKFDQDKAALEQAVRAFGKDWLAGINVGSESLYEDWVTPLRLTEQIHDVKGMVHGSLGAPDVAVGTADTWTSWVRGDVQNVIEASDVIMMNAFPFWQGVDIVAGLSTLQQAFEATGQATGWKKPIVLGETGWPSAGGNFGGSVASLDNTRRFWKDVICWLTQSNYAYFWFQGFDEPNKQKSVEKNLDVEKNFGVASSAGAGKVNFNVQLLCAV